MSRLALPAARLATGSRALARRLGSRTAAWVSRGRRDDLSGWRAVLGCWLRLAVLGFGVYVLWRLVRAVPNLMWMLTGWWTIASWRAGKPAPKATPKGTHEASNAGAGDKAPEPAQLSPRATLVYWLDRLTRGEAGIHLDELHRTLIRHPDLAALKRAEMRAWLDRHHITVDRTLRVGAVAGRSGISRATIEALLQALPPLPESEGSPPPLHASDQSISPAESHAESGVEAVVDPHFDDVARLFS